MNQPVRQDELERLRALVGEWSVTAVFPGAGPGAPPPDGTPADGVPADGVPADGVPAGRAVFEWVLGGAFLAQRTEVPVPEAPDSLAIIACGPGDGRYTQHYYDSRGVARVYEMTLAEGTWQLLRTTADFSPLAFCQRFTGTFSADGNTIQGAWETSPDGVAWEHDFTLVYRRIS